MDHPAASDACTAPPRRRLSREQRRAEIQRTAQSQALRLGLQQLTHRGIAAELGVTHALVVHYEPDMEQLRARTCETLLLAEFEGAREHVSAIEDPVAAVRALIGLMSAPGREAHAALWLDGWSLGRRHRGTADVMRAMMDRWQGLVAGLLDCGATAGAFACVDTRACAWEAIALLDGLNAHMLVGYGHGGEHAQRVAAPMEARLGLAPGTLCAPDAVPEPQHRPPTRETP